MSELPVALDAMGGDRGLAPNVEGAIVAARDDGARVILVGDEAAILAHVDREGARDLVTRGSLLVRHAPDVVAMDEKPAAAARRKKDSSMRRASDLVEAGEACGVLSAGNSGAMMATALLVFGRIDGVARPALGTMLPATTGLCHLVDAGANVECEPFHLAQWAVLSSTYVEHTYGITRPRVGVMSNGEEESKGTELTRATLALLRELPSVNLIGYVEGRDLNAGTVDVIVTDGFTGNVILKTGEGVFRFVMSELKKGYAEGTLKEKAGGALSRSMFERLRKKLDPREFGAAPLLGLARPAFIAHGSSDAYSIRRGIGAVRAHARNDLLVHLSSAITATLPLLERPAASDKARA